jgi:pimeloyl-ACP methyl ester carboxylesterase
MPTIKRLLLVASIVIVVLFAALLFVLHRAGPPLPPYTDAIIDDVLKSPLPSFVSGRTGRAESTGFSIWYESIEPAAAACGTVLLVMGISNDALGWPQSFIDALRDSGYRVVRYDHRGTGLSDWTARDGYTDDYSLTDMAADGVAVLDAIGVEVAHVVGISMGGMVAQELALGWPDRVETLALFMTTGDVEAADLPPISGRVAFELIKVGLRYGVLGGEHGQVKLHIASRAILRGDAVYPIDVRATASQVLYNLRERRGYNWQVSATHQNAVRRSGARLERLGVLDTPTLVVHGTADPFIPVEHGRALADAIPGACWLLLDNLGHDLPEHAIEPLREALVAHFARATAPSPCAGVSAGE